MSIAIAIAIAKQAVNALVTYEVHMPQRSYRTLDESEYYVKAGTSGTAAFNLASCSRLTTAVNLETHMKRH
jgi:hypothetical protein